MAPEALSPEELVRALAVRGVKLSAIGGRRLRAVTHCDVDMQDIEYAQAAIEEALRGSG